MEMMDKLGNYIKLMRVKHYLKNFLIFLPLLFSGNLVKGDYLWVCFMGFIAFSLTCSIVYIINDINDREKDRLHEKKKNRPIASGKVSVGEAMGLILILVIGVVLCITCISIKLYSLILLLIYLFINIGYSFGLKNVCLVDIVILVSGFVIRVLFGGAIIGVEISNWLNLTVMAMAFYLALGKRRNEIIKSKKNTREVLKYYNREFLDKNMYMCLALGIVFYSLWTVDFEVMHRINNNLVWTVPLVIIICMRYSMIVEGNSDGDPVEVVLHDKMLLVLIPIYGLLLMGLLYL